MPPSSSNIDIRGQTIELGRLKNVVNVVQESILAQGEAIKGLSSLTAEEVSATNSAFVREIKTAESSVITVLQNMIIVDRELDEKLLSIAKEVATMVAIVNDAQHNQFLVAKRLELIAGHIRNTDDETTEIFAVVRGLQRGITDSLQELLQVVQRYRVENAEASSAANSLASQMITYTAMSMIGASAAIMSLFLIMFGRVPQFQIQVEKTPHAGHTPRLIFMKYTEFQEDPPEDKLEAVWARYTSKSDSISRDTEVRDCTTDPLPELEARTPQPRNRVVERSASQENDKYDTADAKTPPPGAKRGKAGIIAG
jgi:hypothetical protein